MGMVPSLSFTSTDCKELILAEVTVAECSDGVEGEEACRRRIGKKLERDDLLLIRLIRREDENQSGQSFQDFRKNYKAPRLVYSDPFSTNGEAELIRREEVETFLSHGGKIIKV